MRVSFFGKSPGVVQTLETKNHLQDNDSAQAIKFETFQRSGVNTLRLSIGKYTRAVTRDIHLQPKPHKCEEIVCVCSIPPMHIIVEKKRSVDAPRDRPRTEEHARNASCSDARATSSGVHPEVSWRSWRLAWSGGVRFINNVCCRLHFRRPSVVFLCMIGCDECAYFCRRLKSRLSWKKKKKKKEMKVGSGVGPDVGPSRGRKR